MILIFLAEKIEDQGVEFIYIGYNKSDNNQVSDDNVLTMLKICCPKDYGKSLACHLIAFT
jgi:hypothetical protein